MRTVRITAVEVEDRQFPLTGGAGSDAVHTSPVYAYAVCRLKTDAGFDGVGIAFTLGAGNEIVCLAVKHLAQSLIGRELYELMSRFGAEFSGPGRRAGRNGKPCCKAATGATTPP